MTDDRVDTYHIGSIGLLADGQVFDARLQTDSGGDPVDPYPVTLGDGGVIQVCDDGLVGMQAGGIRVLVIPAELAFNNGPTRSYFVLVTAVYPAP